jgi:hypothetical protein
MRPPRADQPFVLGVIETAVGPAPRVGHALTTADRVGAWRVRWGIGRDDYKVDPGLYALGAPDADSPVLVTANYKLTFDVLRSSVGELSAWVLALDTRGINVWCAAGKSTFSTDELVDRLAFEQVSSLVTHRKVVVPQLGATGVAAHEVRRRSGFAVVYGPVRLDDLPAFLAAGMKATPEMRRVTFPLKDRLVLTPVELAATVKPVAIALGALALLSLLLARPWSLPLASAAGLVAKATLVNASPLLLGVIAGAVLVPALLPQLPFRMFAAKGALLGAALGLGLAVLLGFTPLGALGATLLTAAVSSYLAMNFTGSSTFTSMSGVEKEMRRWIPIQAALVAVAVCAFVAKAVLR